MPDQKMPLQAVIVPVTPFQQNCSVVWCTDTMRGAVVDPGGEIDRILEAATEHGVTIEKILVTHAHSDHAGAVADLSEKLKIPVEGPHRADQFWIDRIEDSGKKYDMPWCRAFTPDRWLEHGDTATVGNLIFDVAHCPGHTPGHVVFHHPGTQIAFVGDVIFQGSIGRSDFPMGDHATLIRSITERLWPMGDDVTFVPGHGSPSTFGRERQANPFVADKVLARQV